MQNNIRYQKAKMVTLLGAVSNAGLGVLKLIGGLLFHSHALVADGLHSFSDLIIDIMVLVASKYGSQDADENHPYGHQRIETATTLFVSLMLILAGVGILWDSLYEIFMKQSTTPGLSSLFIAALSIVLNELLFYYTRHIGQTLNSSLLIANAWHHRADAAASIVVFLGLIGSLLGKSFLDPLAATIVGCLIIKMGMNYGWNSVKELIDTAVDPALLIKIETLVSKIDGVHKIHQLRSRMMGQDILIDMHVLVSPSISISEGHHIAAQIHHTLIHKIPNIKDVVVHVDPEDDEFESASKLLPNRTTLEQSLINRWVEKFPEIESWFIHYLEGKVSIDLIINKKFTSWGALEQSIRQELMQQSIIFNIRLLSHQKTITLDISG